MIARLNGRFVAAVTAALMLGAILIPGTAAQLERPDLYAFVYRGDCTQLAAAGDRFHQIGELELDAEVSLFGRGDVAERMGLQGPTPFLYEESDLRIALQDLIDNPYIIVVREGERSSAPIVACGEILGETQDGILRIDLAPVGGSDIAGIALFEPESGVFGRERTEVTVQVRRGAAAATPIP